LVGGPECGKRFIRKVNEALNRQLQRKKEKIDLTKAKVQELVSIPNPPCGVQQILSMERFRQSIPVLDPVPMVVNININIIICPTVPRGSIFYEEKKKVTRTGVKNIDLVLKEMKERHILVLYAQKKLKRETKLDNLRQIQRDVIPLKDLLAQLMAQLRPSMQWKTAVEVP
jgi:hypothetical protein